MLTTMDNATLAAALYDNQHLPVSNRPETIITVTLTFLGIALTAVSLRLFMRWREQIWGWDDLFVIFAAITVTIGSIITCLMPKDGLGKHYFTLTDQEHSNYFRHIWATNITYASSAACIKIAILIQYTRLFKSNSPSLSLARQLCFGLLTLIALWGICFTLLGIFPCTPIEKNWKPALKGTCIGWGSKVPDVFFSFFVGHSASNTFLDVCVLLLPVPFFKRLRLSGKSRIGLMTLFAMGGVVVSLAVARVVSLCIRRAGTVPVFDTTYATPTIYIFSVLEINVAIMCASIPIFWPLVTSLGSNKILIVNEIEIRSERRSEHFDLVEHGKEDSYMNIGEIDGRNSRASVLGGHSSGKPSPESELHRSPSRLTRTPSLSRLSHTYTTRSHHGHKKSSSSSSSKDALGINLGNNTVSRPSYDSDRRNQKQLLLEKTSTKSLSSVDCGGSDHTHARYKDSYNQGWAVPDFDKVTPPTPLYQTSVQRAQVPFDHIGEARN